MVHDRFETGSAQNAILLRDDLHRSFDRAAWIPMARTTKEGEPARLVVYVVQKTAVTSQFVELWHHVEMQDLIGVNRRCLFARVAYAVLTLHTDFFHKRRVLARDEDLLTRTKSGGLKELPGRAFDHWSRSRSHGSSPTKRLRLRNNGDENMDGGEEKVDIDDDGKTEVDENEIKMKNKWWDEEETEQEFYVEQDATANQRGRKRFRSSSPDVPWRSTSLVTLMRRVKRTRPSMKTTAKSSQHLI